jgi:hypothetical protein
MRRFARLTAMLVILLVPAVLGCASRASLDRSARTALDRLVASRVPSGETRMAAAPARPVRPAPADEGLSLYLVPIAPAAAEPVPPQAPAEAPGAGDAKAPEAKAAEGGAAGEAEAEGERPEFRPIGDMTFRQVVVQDLREMPAALGGGFKHAFVKPENLLILGAAFGADRIVRNNWDESVRDYFARHENQTSLSATGDFGSIIGNPALHFGIGLAWYAAAVRGDNARQHEMSKVLLEALLVNGITTQVLKFSMDDESPNNEQWGWPSGHFSSSLCFASVMHQYYGLGAATPLYLLAGYSAATRLADREHDVSDLVFGGALGLVVGHSVVKGELPQVAGFRVLPYGGRGVGGLMLVRSW